MNYLWLASGGAIGTVLRYFISLRMAGMALTNGFPWGTLTVNLSGSFAIGLLAGMIQENFMSPNVRLFLFAGLLGGFTTFSSFSLENLSLIKNGQISLSVIYILLTNFGGLLLVFTGFFAGQFIKT